MSGRPQQLVRSILAAAMFLCSAAGALAGGEAHPRSELTLRHINDQYARSSNLDNGYTATMTVAATHRGWTVDLSENMFTDKYVNQVRFDETYLTIGRDFSPRAWDVRATVGVARVGEGIYGERFQNFVHRLLNEGELDLGYVEDGYHAVLGLRASHVAVERERFRVTAHGEAESAGFKRHALVSLGATWEVAASVHLLAEAGFRWTETDFSDLEPFLDDSAPAFAVGVSYKRWFEVRWAQNTYGTGERHFHLTSRIPIGKN